jgi:hypothetical protein
MESDDVDAVKVRSTGDKDKRARKIRMEDLKVLRNPLILSLKATFV